MERLTQPLRLKAEATKREAGRQRTGEPANESLVISFTGSPTRSPASLCVASGSAGRLWLSTAFPARGVSDSGPAAPCAPRDTCASRNFVSRVSSEPDVRSAPAARASPAPGSGRAAASRPARTAPAASPPRDRPIVVIVQARGAAARHGQRKGPLVSSRRACSQGKADAISMSSTRCRAAAARERAPDSRSRPANRARRSSWIVASPWRARARRRQADRPIGRIGRHRPFGMSARRNVDFR